MDTNEDSSEPEPFPPGCFPGFTPHGSGFPSLHNSCSFESRVACAEFMAYVGAYEFRDSGNARVGYMLGALSLGVFLASLDLCPGVTVEQSASLSGELGEELVRRLKGWGAEAN
jgi:hypothetical protein